MRGAHAKVRGPFHWRVGVVPVWIPVAIAAAVGAFLVLGKGSGSTVKVTVAAAGPRQIITTVGGLGQADAGLNVSVTLPFDASVLSILVQPGQQVTKGQPLFDIDPTAFRTSLAELTIRQQTDTASLGVDQASLAQLQAGGSPEAIAAVRAKINADTARLALDQQLISLARNPSPSVIAPVDGTIGAVSAQVNRVALANHPVLDILDLSSVRVTAKLPVADEGVVNVGDAAQIDFGDVPGLSLHGALISKSPVIINGGLDFQVVAQAANTPDHRAHPGMSAFVGVAVTSTANVAINKLGVLNKTDVPTAFVVKNGVAVQRKLVLGVTDGQYYEVLSGISNGEQVVIVGGYALADGTKVRVTGTRS